MSHLYKELIHYKADELTTPHTTNYDGGIFLTYIHDYISIQVKDWIFNGTII